MSKREAGSGTGCGPGMGGGFRRHPAHAGEIHLDFAMLSVGDVAAATQRQPNRSFRVRLYRLPVTASPWQTKAEVGEDSTDYLVMLIAVTTGFISFPCNVKFTCCPTVTPLSNSDFATLKVMVMAGQFNSFMGW